MLNLYKNLLQLFQIKFYAIIQFCIHENFFSMTFLPFCWLVPDNPGPFPAPFNRTSGDFDRFKKWFSTLTSIKNPEKADAIDAIVLTYQNIKQNNEELFSINCIEARPKNSLHQRMRPNILNIVYKLKKYHDIPDSPPTNGDIIENVIGRILVYAHLNGIEYHKRFCELVLPIIHVYYYGVLQSEAIRYDMDLIEAMVADSFVRLMTNPVFYHLNVFPPSKFMNELLNKFIETIKPYSIYQMIMNANIKPSCFASRWIETIFVKDLDFSEVIKIWDYLFDKLSQKISISRSASSFLSQSSSLLSLQEPHLSHSTLISPSLSQPSSSATSIASSQSMISSSVFQKFIQINTFHQNIILLCAGCVLTREKVCRDAKTYKYLEIIQDLNDVTAEDIISQIENLEL